MDKIIKRLEEIALSKKVKYNLKAFIEELKTPVVKEKKVKPKPIKE